MQLEREILEMWNGIEKKTVTKRVATTNGLVMQGPVITPSLNMRCFMLLLRRALSTASVV
jgi:hypothetical protein